MRSRANTEEKGNAGGLLIIVVAALVASASLLGPDSIRASITQYSLYIWGAILLLSAVFLWGRTELGMLLLVHALFVSTGVGLTLKDYLSVPFGLGGGLIWGAVLVTSFTFGLLYFAQYVLPLKGNEGWSEGFRILTRHYFSSMPSVAAPAKQDRRVKRKIKTPEARKKAQPLPASFEIMKAGNLNSNQVLALSKGSGFSRAAGPGFVLLYGGERIAGLIDLRKHARVQRVKANTRDGIPLETDISIAFRIRQRPSENGEEELQHPYDKDAIFAVSYAASIDKQDNLHEWKERIAPLGALLLTAEVSKHTLNDLYHGEQAGVPIVEALKQSVQSQLADAVVQEGIEVLNLGLSQFELPEAVTGQRIRNWQADWKRRIKMRQASSDAEALRRIKKARARTQVEIIENIMANIEVMRRSGETELKEVILLRMIETLDQALTDESVRMMIPQQIMSQLMTDSSDRLQAWVDEQSGRESK